MLQLLALLTLLPLQQLEQSLDLVEKARTDGRHKEALVILADIERGDAELFRLNNIAYLRSVVQREAGLEEQACQGFKALLESDFPLPDVLLLHIIRTGGSLSVTLRAEAFEAFLTRFPSHPDWSSTALMFADELAENGRHGPACDWYRRIASAGTSNARSARFRLSLLLLNPEASSAASGARAEGVLILERLLEENDRDSIALEAASRLRSLEAVGELEEEALSRRAAVFLNHQKPAGARLYLDQLLSCYPSSPRRPEYEYMSGRSRQLQGRPREASQIYEAVYRRFPNSEWGIYSRCLAGRLYLDAKNYAQAANVFADVVEKHVQSPHYQRAVMGLVEARTLKDGPASAEKTLAEATNRGGAGSEPLNYYLSRLQFTAGRCGDAVKSLTRIAHLSSAELPSGVTREEVLFWKGVCEEKTGCKEQALRSYEEAARGRPNYFSYLARKELPGPAPEAAIRPDNSMSAVSWWKSDGISRRGVFRSLDERKAADSLKPELRRLQELLFLRLLDEAYFELTRQSPETLFPNRAAYLYQRARLARRAGLYHLSLNDAQELQDLLFGRTAPDFYPQELQELLFPLYYWDLARQYGERYRVDPFLILAIIRQESAFRADAISPASARGLMQIMPATGRGLARQLKIRFEGNSALYRPRTSIQLGTYYLHQLLRNYGGTLEKALAAYNGGGRNVRRWEQGLSSREPVLFVSHIGFRETKLYVLRVIGDYFAYRSVYAGEDPRGVFSEPGVREIP